MTNTEATANRVRQIPAVDLSRTPSMLSRIDYVDAFEVDVRRPGDCGAEEWMRTILEGAPLSMRARLLSAWSAIGLKLRLPGSDRSILGWDIRAGDDDFVLLGAPSRIGMPGELLLRRKEGGLLFQTFVRHDNSIVRALWARIEASHVKTVRSLLARVCG
ncbi:hypothetical protein A5765_00955 [Mycolicibacterium celeriflavum]|uniref:hypothetical protein n=1 Tax=Mycolicibacterium celeriflavum TaxID=1249101 RepID=UPI0007FBC961|nr:hypothetical protein [Mycolicibacterium celeriflavum]OBG13143.1 hypothetical protein A5765_00955 [Mycolicibacterium celeriflavum]